MKTRKKTNRVKHKANVRAVRKRMAKEGSDPKSIFVVRNGEWFLSEGPDWAISTWTMNKIEATRYPSLSSAKEVAAAAVKAGHRPFGRASEFARGVRVIA